MKRFSDAELQRSNVRKPISSWIVGYVTWDRSKINCSLGVYWACCPFLDERTPSFH